MSRVSSVTDVTRTVAEILNSRDYARRVPTTSTGDLGRLVDTLNRLLVEVEARDHELRRKLEELTDSRDDAQTTSALLRRVKDELKSRSQELDAALLKAEAASEAKGQFLANMSHEIRTPMNGVLGMADLLSRSSLDGRQSKMVGAISKSGQALLTIINDILDFSKIESGKFDIDLKPFSLRMCVEDVAAIMQPRLEQKGLELAVDYAPEISVQMIGDAGRIRQILTNVIGNAIKFTDKGRVSVRVAGTLATATANLTITVADTGIGIPGEKVEAVFQKFSQVDNTSTRRHEGTGLGLAICKMLIEKMGGSVRLESTYGVGTTLSLTLALPLANEDKAPAPIADGLAGRRILLLAASGATETSLPEQLVAGGLTVTVTDRLDDAMRLLEQGHADGAGIDLVLIDTEWTVEAAMPVVAALRTSERHGTTPVIILAAIGQRGDGKLARSIGVNGYLAKPISASLLLETVATVLGDVGEGRQRLVTRHVCAEERGGQSAPEPAHQAVPSSFADARVLLVDDNLVNQEVANEYFWELGCDVTIAGNGREAIRAVEAGEFDIVFMDCLMPEMDGFQATAAIRELERLGGRSMLPIIALTANAFASDRDKCLAAGMNDYLSKPFATEDLARALASWLPRSPRRNAEAGSARPALSAA